MFPIFEWIVSRVFRNPIAKKSAYAAINSATYVSIDYFFDFILYYFAIRQFGAVVGGGGVMILGIGIDYLMLKRYLSRNEIKDDDWFGLEEVKKLRDYEGNGKIRRYISELLKKGNYAALFIVAFYSNPCLATIYSRPSHRKHAKMNRRDWLVFSASLVIEILWIVIISGAVAFERLLRLKF